MELVLELRDSQAMLGPSHVNRGFNTWADELPNFRRRAGFFHQLGAN